MKYLLICTLTLLLSSCATQAPSLYEQIGGQAAVEQITDNFIAEIEFNATIFPYFKDSDIDRFRSKFIEHLCVNTGGPCQYSGDSMLDVHKGMHISERDFNLTVDLLINAMSKAHISHRLQNRILARLAPMRKDMLYK